MAAELLQHLTEEERRRILEEMQGRDPLMAETLRRSLFTFADLLQQEDSELIAFIRSIPRVHWLTALRGLGESELQRVRELISDRAWSDLQDEMKSQGPQPLSRVEEARRKILELWAGRR